MKGIIIKGCICCERPFSPVVFQLLVLLLPRMALPLSAIPHPEWWMATAHLLLLPVAILTHPLRSRMDSTRGLPLLLATWAMPIHQLLQVQDSSVSRMTFVCQIQKVPMSSEVLLGWKIYFAKMFSIQVWCSGFFCGFLSSSFFSLSLSHSIKLKRQYVRRLSWVVMTFRLYFPTCVCMWSCFCIRGFCQMSLLHISKNAWGTNNAVVSLSSCQCLCCITNCRQTVSSADLEAAPLSFLPVFCVLGMYPSGFDYMAPPPPYPGPPQNWTAPPQNWTAPPPPPPGLFLSSSLFFLSVCLCHCTRQIWSVCLKVNHFKSRHQKKGGADVSFATHQNYKG